MDTILLSELHTEACCPICLDYLSDPVITDCGHNFCHSCILQCWEGLQEAFPCPICFHHCHGKLHINTQLCQVVSLVQKMPGSKSNRRLMCEKHSEVLDLFCENDLELLCSQCRVSSDHHRHFLTPIKEASRNYRRKLQDYLEHLQAQMEENAIQYPLKILKCMRLLVEKRDWENNLQSEFEEFKQFLQREHDVKEAMLHKEEKDITEELTENRNLLSIHLATLRSVLSHVKEKCLLADMDLLEFVGSITNTYEGIQAPEVFSYELRKESCYLPPHHFSLQKMATFQVDVTLDPQDVPPVVVISEDRKSMTLRKRTNTSPHLSPHYVTVWSQETFGSGRSFWQVEVRGTGEWCLGVCSESLRSTGFIWPECGSSTNSNCWQMKQSKAELEEAEVSSHIGVFLDWELGEVSFYDLNKRSCVCVLMDTFTEILVPFSLLNILQSLLASVLSGRNEMPT